MKTKTINDLRKMIKALDGLMDSNASVRVDLFDAKCKLEDAESKLITSMGPFAPEVH